jgi:hypothetical protein
VYRKSFQIVSAGAIDVRTASLHVRRGNDIQLLVIFQKHQEDSSRVRPARFQHLISAQNAELGTMMNLPDYST